MKLAFLFVGVAVVAMLTSAALAQRPDRERREGDRPRPEGRADGEGPRRGPPRGDRPEGSPEGRGGFRPPIIAVLDADEDGVISAEEIKNAAAALKKLDKNEDGKLTMDELRPDFAGGDRPEGRRPPEGGRFEGRSPRDGERARPEGRRPPEGGARDRPRGEGEREEGDRPERPRRPEA